MAKTGTIGEGEMRGSERKQERAIESQIKGIKLLIRP